MITLTSDFGYEDPYAAEMKGVILTINPNANIIDITHGVEKFNIRIGAFMLASAAPYFLKGTVHLAVVDPGVGTERRAILVQTKQGFFVGPDNGILILAARYFSADKAGLFCRTRQWHFDFSCSIPGHRTYIRTY